MKLLKFLAIERLLRGLLILFVGLGGLRISSNHLQSITQWNDALQKVSNLNSQVFNSVLHSSAYEYLFRLKNSTTSHWVALFTAITSYGILICIEAVGLWRDWHWAERLTVISTSAFLPLEIWELTRGFSALKVLAFVFNIFVVYWLYTKKWHRATSIEN